ncbi:MAG TPA: aldose 1-epimerase family protein [Chitinophagaceae bacterium]|nr:aldose 1-epimerase family protein [Chitinophagaceae bacterium]
MNFPGSFWSDKITNVLQVGGIETSVLDNGAGRGTRIAWVNTGTGMRYKVVLDRAMDIADAFYNQYGLAWLSHSGITAPQPLVDKGLDWLRMFGGGLVTTCGLSHVGGPEKDEHGERGIHGLISNTPAEVSSIIQPDPGRGQFEMSITGVIKETKIFGPSLELKRTISSTLGKSSIRITDEIINRGNTAAPHMLLYHCNFGWPLADEGARLLWKGSLFRKDGHGGLVAVESNEDLEICPPVLASHNGTGEEVIMIDTATDENGKSICGLYNPRLGFAVVMKYAKLQLPWMTNWRHWSKGEYVTGIEPGTHPPIGQSKARREKTLIMIEPGEIRNYEIDIDIVTNETEINLILNQLR